MLNKRVMLKSLKKSQIPAVGWGWSTYLGYMYLDVCFGQVSGLYEHIYGGEAREINLILIYGCGKTKYRMTD